MRFAIAVLMLGILTACGSPTSDGWYANAPEGAEATGADEADPLLMDQPPKQKPASFKGRTHVLVVTVRDIRADHSYVKDKQGRCVAVDPPEAALAQGMPILTVKSIDDKSLATIRGPVLGESATDRDWCEAKFTITVPYRAKYRILLSTAYDGIADSTDPKPPVVVTEGDYQDVLYLD